MCTRCKHPQHCIAQLRVRPSTGQVVSVEEVEDCRVHCGDKGGLRLCWDKELTKQYCEATIRCCPDRCPCLQLQQLLGPGQVQQALLEGLRPVQGVRGRVEGKDEGVTLSGGLCRAAKHQQLTAETSQTGQVVKPWCMVQARLSSRWAEEAVEAEEAVKAVEAEEAVKAEEAVEAEEAVKAEEAVTAVEAEEAEEAETVGATHELQMMGYQTLPSRCYAGSKDTHGADEGQRMGYEWIVKDRVCPGWELRGPTIAIVLDQELADKTMVQLHSCIHVVLPLNMQRIGESRWRPLELCFWPEQGKLPAKGEEYPGLGYKRLRDKLPKAQ
ncbi:hypothetical protein QJQ45_010460 [Haematococcus lacustris]|nr:hypothetical protein QJQ45_003647 [Haematococcus lacustris]KAJ9532408.1 hypothetical protein QJQ45_010468 [Haematococcus lacustris]KAJ9532413.1 hypothetical protein QJQ45_010460 [Haematococcus lacustris]